MGDHTKVNGRTIICMGMDNTLGVMAGNTMGSTIWIKNMAMASIIGPMEGDMKAIGEMENSMEKGSTFCLME